MTRRDAGGRPGREKATALAYPAELDGLPRLGVQPALGQYLREVWRRRAYAIEIPRSELRAQHLHTLLGNVWLVLNPLLQVGVYYVIFGLLLSTRRGVDNFVTFLAIGVFMFHFSQRSITGGSRAIVRNEGLIRSIRFPRAILVISSTVSQAIAFMPVLAVMLMVTVLETHTARWSWLVLPPIIVLQTVFNLGGAFITARINTVFRDLEDLLPFVFRLTLYLSGVMYSVTNFVSDPALLRIWAVNPFYCFIEAARWALLGISPGPFVWQSLAVWSVVLPIIGFVFFRAAEETYGRA